ncbi:MAG: DivIVA domain-containing protein [Thermodesulfobacteriota bacterium]|nr:DivIVA domain-containing protein [Thermodesulfobacteriota bacterium]
MRITPIEIQQHRFKTRIFGYDTSAVDHFLELLADELERIHKQHNELKESLARTQRALNQMREREKAIQATLMTAQQVTKELQVNAQKEAEIIIAEAHLEGERVIRDANERRVQLVSEIQEIKRQKISFEGGLRSLLENHLKLMDVNALQIDTDQHAHLLQPLIRDEDIDDQFNFP